MANTLKDIADGVKQRMAENGPYVAARMFGAFPAPKPVQIQPPPLEQFLAASPEQRNAYLQAIPAKDYARVTGGLMDEANKRYGAAASVLQPLFAGASAVGGLESLAQQSQTPEIGMQSALAELNQMLGLDTGAPPA